MQTFDKKPQVEEQPSVTEEAANETYGGAAATLLGAGIGCFIYGLLVLLSEASTDFANNVLKLSKEVGPLSGKVVFGMSAWLIAWGICYFVMRNKRFNLSRILLITLGLIAVGLLLSFPPFFDLFAPA